VEVTQYLDLFWFFLAVFNLCGSATGVLASRLVCL